MQKEQDHGQQQYNAKNCYINCIKINIILNGYLTEISICHIVFLVEIYLKSRSLNANFEKKIVLT